MEADTVEKPVAFSTPIFKKIKGVRRDTGEVQWKAACPQTSHRKATNIEYLGEVETGMAFNCKKCGHIFVAEKPE